MLHDRSNSALLLNPSATDYGLAFAHPFVRRSPFPSDTFDGWPGSIRPFFCRTRDSTAAADTLLTLGITVGLFKAYAPLFAPRPLVADCRPPYKAAVHVASHRRRRSSRLGRSSLIAVHPTKPLSASRAIAAGGTSISPSYFPGGRTSPSWYSSVLFGLPRSVFLSTACLGLHGLFSLNGLFGTPRSVFLSSPVWDSKVCLFLESCLGLYGLSINRRSVHQQVICPSTDSLSINRWSVHHPKVCPSQGLSITQRSVHPPDSLTIP